MIAPRHAADLRHGLVALVDEQQRIFRQIFEQGGGRLAGQATGEEAAVILDTRATARRRDHLQIELGALLQPLRFQQPAFGDQFLQSLGKFVADRLARLLKRRPRRHIVRVGIDLYR